MPNRLGYSVYLSTFGGQQNLLAPLAGSGALVFLSLHISEEFGPEYCRQAEEACRWLAGRGFQIVADVSVKTREMFGEPDLLKLARRLGVWALRIDYGLEQEEIEALAREIPIVLNASTTDPEKAAAIAQGGKLVMAMHNFYPRPETGLDEAFLLESTRRLQAAGLKALGFLPGDRTLRGPIGEGLPTLEAHRGMLPSACYADLVLRFGLDGVFLGDPDLSEGERERIDAFCTDGILRVPAALAAGYESLYDRVFTNRPDAPAGLVRFAESRVYSCIGGPVEPENCVGRSRGSVTMDNRCYGRYSGEVQLTRTDYPADSRVNVIGHVPAEAMLLADCIDRGKRFMLVRP